MAIETVFDTLILFRILTYTLASVFIFMILCDVFNWKR
jgi:hypothetical protein